MPFFEKQNTVIFFSHIPKTGGSSVNEFFHNNSFKRIFYSSSIQPCSKQHRHNKDVELLEKIKEYNPIFSFTFFRNPIDRIISEYGMRKKSNKLTNNDFHNFVIKIFEDYESNKFVNDNHIRPQNEFIHDGMKIYSFGNWSNFIDDITEYNSFKKLSFPHIQKSHKWSWEPLPDTIDLIKNFYAEDFYIYNNLK